MSAGKVGTYLFLATNAASVALMVGVFLRVWHVADWVSANAPGPVMVIVFFILVDLTKPTPPVEG